MAGRLDGKIAIVMGAGSVAEGWSNGKATAVSYAREGASVVCVDRVEARARETAEIISAEGFVGVAVKADATRQDEVQGVVGLALSKFGALDIMHNNVGVGNSSGTPDQISLSEWDREISQNLTTTYLGIRCAAPHMRARGGVITNVSSTLATRFLARPTTAYTVAKAGVEALTRACAAGYGRDGIRVNCLRIGFSETPLVLRALEKRKLSLEEQEAELQKTRKKIPLRAQHGDAFDVGAAAVFLASDDAKHLTGVILNIDGGLDCAPL